MLGVRVPGPQEDTVCTRGGIRTPRFLGLSQLPMPFGYTCMSLLGRSRTYNVTAFETDAYAIRLREDKVVAIGFEPTYCRVTTGTRPIEYTTKGGE